ncbi:hypothetical protein MTO96_044864 [Rhipicephalus appendiculatus]
MLIDTLLSTLVIIVAIKLSGKPGGNQNDQGLWTVARARPSSSLSSSVKLTTTTYTVTSALCSVPEEVLKTWMVAAAPRIGTGDMVPFEPVSPQVPDRPVFDDKNDGSQDPKVVSQRQELQQQLNRGISVPTVAEGRWAALLARQAVTPAQEGLEVKVHGECKLEKAEHGEQLDQGEVDHSGHSDEAGGDAEVDEVNAAEVLTTAVAEDENRVAEIILLVYAADNQDLNADIDNEHHAAAAKAAETVAAAFVVEATEGVPAGGKAELNAATPNEEIACKVTTMMAAATVDNEPACNLRVSGLASNTRAADSKALFCGPAAGGTLRES